jgi:hypothetical protein
LRWTYLRARRSARNLAAGDRSYRIIKGILATGADTGHQEQVAAVHRAAATAAVPAFLRDPDSLFSDDLFLGTSPSGPAPVSATVLHLPTTSTTSPGTTSDTVTSTVTTSSTTNGDRGGPVRLGLDSGLREALKALRLTAMLATLDDNRLAQARDGRLTERRLFHRLRQPLPGHRPGPAGSRFWTLRPDVRVHLV